MKLITFERQGNTGVGIVTERGVVDLGARMAVHGMKDLLARGLLEQARSFADDGPDFALDSLRLLPVVPDPAHFYCVGTNYADHLAEVRAAGVQRPQPQKPSMFIRFPETVVGAEAAMVIPRVSEQLDYEAELALVIGKGGRHIDRDHALSHIAGYTCFNDGSVRDWQFHSSQVTPGKNFLDSGALGPWMVTADDIGDPGRLAIEFRLNGRTLQHSNTSRMIFDIAAIVSYASAMVPLRPGDVIATGTPEGVGFSRKPPIFLQHGDICEVIIERIGVLRNTVRREPPLTA